MGYYKNTLRYRKTSHSITITKYKSCDGCTEVEIPAVIEGLPVTEIGIEAFYQCQTLTQVILPESLRTIRGRAFFGCENLKSINIPNSVERIVFWAFKNCYGLADAEGLVIVGGILYNYIGTKDSIILPDHVTEIEEGAFGDPIKEILNMPKVQCSDGRILTEEDLHNGCKL